MQQQAYVLAGLDRRTANNMKLLALDQATHTTGYAVFENEKPVVISHFDAKGADFADRLVDIRQTIISLIDKYEIDTVAFEDIQLQNNVVQNVKTFKMLAEVFGVILELLHEKKIKYYVVPPIVWKATFKFAGKGRAAEKKAAQTWIAENYGIKCTQDEADAACIGTHILKTENENYDWA